MKRVISLIVALAMLLSVGSGAVFAVGQTGYSDVDGTGYETPVSILGALNIMGGYTDGNFHPYATITRAEMAAVSVRLRGITDYGDLVSLDETQYLDMDGHPYAAAVAYARSLGIVDGVDDGYFYPDDPVTYEQAIKMIVGALGYDYYATASGGYPNGYLRVAGDLKLTSGIGLTVGSYITRGDVAKIAYRALTVDMMKATSYSGNSEVTYEIVEGRNILNTYFDVEKLRGIVEENSRTAIDGSTSLKENEVKIGDEVFNDGGTNIGDYLGYYVTFYALESNDQDKRIIISYNVESSKNDYIKINAEDIDNVRLNSSKYIIEYWRNQNDRSTRQLKISATPLVIYNGVALADFNLNDLKPDYGQLTLIDNDRDGEYDVVDILAYEVFLVLSTSSSSGNVTANPSYTTGLRSIKLLENDEDYTTKLVDGNGNSVSLSSITKNSVLFVAASKDDGSTVRTAIVSNSSVSGSIQSVTANGTYVINGQEYDVVKYMVDENSLSIGDTGTFYLTHDGRIAGFEGEQRVKKSIGMFIAYNRGKMSEGGNVIKIMKSDGSFGIYNLAGSVKLNGVSYSGTALFDMIADPDTPLFGKRQPESNLAGKVIPEPSLAGILYKLNSNGDISEIIMNDNPSTVSAATDGMGYSGEEIRCVVQRGKSTTENTGDSLYYSTKYHSFHRGGRQVFVTDNTLLMYSQDNWQKTDDSQIYWVSYPTALWENYYHEWFEAYFYYIGDHQYADFVVFYDGYDAQGDTNGSSSRPDMRSAAINDRIRIVDRIIESYDVDGNTNYTLIYWEGGSSQRIDFHEDYYNTWFRDGKSVFWRRGDMVRFTRLNNKIVQMGSIFTSNSWGDTNPDYYNTWNDPTGLEVNGGKNPDHKYRFPMGRYELVGYGNMYQEYYVGRITSIDTLRYFSTLDFQYGAGLSLTDQPIEGDCYKLVYDNRGYIVGADNVGTGAISEGQLVLIRKKCVINQIIMCIQETYILYEYEDIEESQTLRNEYRALYPDNEWRTDATTTALFGFDDYDQEDVHYDAILPEETLEVIPEL